MEKVFKMAGGFFSKMTELFMTLMSFAIMAEILFGMSVMGLSVIDNIMEMITMLGSNGIVGLMTLVIMYSLVVKE